MSLYKRPGSQNWWCKFTVNKEPVRVSTGETSKTEARKVEERLRAEKWAEAKRGVSNKLWEDAVVLYLGQAEFKSTESRETTMWQIGWLTEHLDGRRLVEITDEIVEQVRARRAGEGVAKGTVLRTMGVLSSVLHPAHNIGWLTRLPKIDLTQPKNKRLRFITREQVGVLLAELPKHKRALTVFALETGLRRHNVTHLRWEQVDLDRGHCWVNAEDAKSNTGIPVPLSAAAVSILRAQSGQHPEYVFVYRGRPVTQTSTKSWRDALARARITDFRWHDLRHTWASWHRQDGTPLDVLQDLGGWKSEKMVRIYAHLSADHLAGYVRRREKSESQGTEKGTVEKAEIVTI